MEWIKANKKRMFYGSTSVFDARFSIMRVEAIPLSCPSRYLRTATVHPTLGRIVLKSTHRSFFDLLPNEPKLIILVVRPQEHMFEPYLPPFSIIKDTLRVLRCGFFEKRKIS